MPLDLPPRPEIWLPPKPAIVRSAADLIAAKADRKMRLGMMPGITPVVGGRFGDPYIANVVALLKFEGANGSTTITDTSPTGTLWQTTSSAVIDTSQFKFGASSLKTGQTTTSGVQSTTTNSNFNLFGGDFTIEGFFYPIAISPSTNFLWNNGPDDTKMDWMEVQNGKLCFGTSTSSNWALRITGTTAITAGAWYHWALVKVAGTFYMFLNGNLEGTSTTTTYLVQDRQFILGRKSPNGGSPNSWNGWLDELRITKGVGRYTAAFAPPTRSFPIF
ncbi:MAG: LamG domain-containing protein [Mesorhizobium sp.]|uniref:LamG domain-containing protein n=1 Tax=Mesorhizobium sp. TaxID=1871066 RepID=UPI000FE9839D|nr:LamG domain-containing protein [Mesorhizobium sp.]RWM02091.1 MAG: LamG domain-containing protein [Mesorhizobium sp.]